MNQFTRIASQQMYRFGEALHAVMVPIVQETGQGTHWHSDAGFYADLSELGHCNLCSGHGN